MVSLHQENGQPQSCPPRRFQNSTASSWFQDKREILFGEFQASQAPSSQPFPPYPRCIQVAWPPTWSGLCFPDQPKKRSRAPPPPGASPKAPVLLVPGSCLALRPAPLCHWRTDFPTKTHTKTAMPSIRTTFISLARTVGACAAPEAAPRCGDPAPCASWLHCARHGPVLTVDHA